jgi:hypothetical protein
MLALPPALSVTFCEEDEVVGTNPLCPDEPDEEVDEVLVDGMLALVVEDPILLLVEEVLLSEFVVENDVVVVC